MNDYRKELDAVMAAASIASRIILDAYGTLVADPAAQANITTKTDLASQEAILHYLMERFPEDGFAAEEDTETLKRAKKSGRRLWVIDPIDGTRGFMRKSGEFSAMIGFCIEGRVVAGVVAEPALDRVTYASEGQGCWTRSGENPPVACLVSEAGALSSAILARSHTKNPADPGEFGTRLGLSRFLEKYSAGVKLAAVARGEADLYINDYPSYRDWDLCAGIILVLEAGGKATDWTGRPLEFGRAGNLQDRGLASSNAKLHEEILKRLAK